MSVDSIAYDLYTGKINDKEYLAILEEVKKVFSLGSRRLLEYYRTTKKQAKKVKDITNLKKAIFRHVCQFNIMGGKNQSYILSL